MHIEMRDLKDGVGLSITVRGVITEKEYLNAFSKHLTQDKHKLKKYRYCLSDWTAVTKEEIPTQAIEQIAKLCKSAALVNPDVVNATVADQDIIFGLARMAQTLRDGTNWENEIFRNRQDAEAWLKKRVKEKYGIDDLIFD